MHGRPYQPQSQGSVEAFNISNKFKKLNLN